MCDDCDCRELAPIGELSTEHERIGSLAAILRREVESGSPDRAAALSALQAALGPHLAKEEIGLFAQLEGRPGFAWYLEQLHGEHARARSSLLSPDAVQMSAPEVLAALDDLTEHIQTEEYDLFPASRLILDDLAWAKVAAAHDAANAHATR